MSRSSVGIDSYGPFLTMYTGDGEERYTFRFSQPSYGGVPAVAYTDRSGVSNTRWHG